MKLNCKRLENDGIGKLPHEQLPDLSGRGCVNVYRSAVEFQTDCTNGEDPATYTEMVILSSTFSRRQLPTIYRSTIVNMTVSIILELAI